MGLVPTTGQRRSWHKNAAIIVLRATVSRRAHTRGSPKVPQEGNEAREPRSGADGGDVSGRPAEATWLLALLLAAVTAPGHGQDIGNRIVGAWYGVEGIDAVTNADARTVITGPLEAEASAQIKCWPTGAFNVLVLFDARLPPGVGDTSVTLTYRFDRGVPGQARAYLIYVSERDFAVSLGPTLYGALLEAGPDTFDIRVHHPDDPSRDLARGEIDVSGLGKALDWCLALQD